MSLSSFSQQDIFPSTEETVLPCHLSPTACSTSQHSEITRMITFTCTPLNRTKQIQASLLRADWSHHSKQDSPKQRGASRTAPAHPSHTLPKAPALGWAVAHLHSWGKPGFDTSSSHWKCQMRSRWLGWE